MPDDATLATRAAAPGQSAPLVMGLDHVVLRVTDIDRSIAFYEQVLGLHVERRLAEIGLVQLRAGTSMIDLVPRTEDEDDGRNMDHLAVRIAEMDVPALTVQSDKKIVALVAGTSRQSDNFASALVRFDVDGSLDKAFGAGSQEKPARHTCPPHPAFSSAFLVSFRSRSPWPPQDGSSLWRGSPFPR